MTLVDVNLLVYAYNTESPHHAAARQWLNEQLNNTRPLGLPWPTILGFIRITTNPRILPRPHRVRESWNVVRSWLQQPSVWIPTPGEQHASVYDALLSDDSFSPKLIHDAHLAALAIEHGLILCSTDGDFARFAGLRWENPLAGPGAVRESKGRYGSRRKTAER
jgi:toxin-antitoxin system PIN domain toxin